MRRRIRHVKNAVGGSTAVGPETMMKAVRLHEYGGPEKLQYEDGVPDPSLQPDSILIKTVAAKHQPHRLEGSLGRKTEGFSLAIPRHPRAGR